MTNQHTLDQTVRTVWAPAASTVRFGLLVAGVLATASFVFLNVYLSVPGRAEATRLRTAQCQAALEADPGWIAGDDADQLRAATARWRTCLQPLFVDQLLFVGAGTAVLFGLAGAGYLVQPHWLIRRRRLRVLTMADAPALVTTLDQLSRDIGLSRPPEWRLAPFGRTASGQAFGSPGRRRVQLDAGLALRHTADRPAFRAVVLHELAHLKNRDVDKTYLTVNIWRAFLVVAVVPYVALVAHPELLRAPLDWHWRTSPFVLAPGRTAYLLGSLLLLTGLVYLTRNAVLRVRETHADAVAAACDGPDSALPVALARLRPPRRWWQQRTP